MSEAHPPPGAHRAAVLGHPIEHSLSPVLHRAAYAALGLDRWTYAAVDCDEAGLPAFLAGLDGSWVGLSLTMPLKRAIRPLLAGETALAAAVGAVNTVLVTAGGLRGSNTDVEGMVSAVREAGVASVTSAAVLGGGATATSALAALQRLGCAAPTVHVRRPEAAGELLAAAGRLGVRCELAGFDPAGLRRSAGVELLVSTLPGPAAGERAEELATLAAGTATLLDVAYHPWPSRLATAWARRGGRVVSGFAMLLHQAAEQVRLMTGRPAPVEAMRAAGESELARRGGTER